MFSFIFDLFPDNHIPISVFVISLWKHDLLACAQLSRSCKEIKELELAVHLYAS